MTATSGGRARHLAGIVLDESALLTLADICHACAVQGECIVELVEEGVLDPVGLDAQHWRFSGTQLRVAIIASRLQADLGVNAAGAALALQLLEEVDALRARVRALHGTAPNRR
jgi:chaperone modulatory protein CbpM